MTSTALLNHLFTMLTAALYLGAVQQNTAFRPGQLWNDTDGRPIRAHSAGLLAPTSVRDFGRVPCPTTDHHTPDHHSLQSIRSLARATAAQSLPPAQGGGGGHYYWCKRPIVPTRLRPQSAHLADKTPCLADNRFTYPLLGCTLAHSVSGGVCTLPSAQTVPTTTPAGMGRTRG